MNGFYNPGINNPYLNTNGYSTNQNSINPNFNPNNQGNSPQLIKVNGLDSAKAYPTVPNSTVALFHSEKDIMYIKSTDASNFPTVRIFKFTEITNSESERNEEEYVTVAQFEAFKEELLNGKQFIPKQSTNNHKTGSNKRNDGGV